MKPPGGAAGLDVLTLLRATQQVGLLDTVTANAAAPGILAAAIRLAPPLVDVPADGVEFPFDWGAVPPGVDRAELAPVAVDVVAERVSQFGGYPLGELGTRLEGDGKRLAVTVPAGRLIRRLTITDLMSGDKPLASEQDLTDQDLRLTVSRPDPRGGWAAPTVSVPSVAGYGAIPPTLTGASFSKGLLQLPDLPGPLAIAVVSGARPDSFTPQPLTVGKVIGWATPTPVDLTLTGPDGVTLWNFAGAMPDGTTQAVDVTVPVSCAVEALRAAGRPVAGSLTLRSRFPCKVGFAVSSVEGDLIRDLPGTTTIELTGEPVTLPLDTPLPAATPSAAVADVTVTYGGRRLAAVSDPLPAAGAQRGVVVRQHRVLRVLPPLALRGEQVSRIGLVGYCPQQTALLVRLVPAATQPDTAPAVSSIGKPGTATVDPTTTVGVIWVDLPEPVAVDESVAIEVSAGTGALYWVTGPHPLVRVVVLDPDPGGRPIMLGNATLLTIDQPIIGRTRAALPAAAFAAAAPLLASALFCTVEITDGELRYPWGA